MAALRLFVALYPPPGVADALLGALGALDLPAHRAVPRDQVHMTLQFVGDTPARDLDRVIESVDRAVAGVPAFTLTPGSLVAIPARGPARLVAATTDFPGGLREIQGRLARRLARNVRRRPGDRFLPHLTLCRFRPPAAAEIPEAIPGAPAFRIDAIRLMRSTLTLDGARHREVACAGLAAG